MMTGADRSRIAAAAWAVLSLSATLPLRSADVVPIGGAPFAARLSSIDDKWNVTLETEQGRRSLDASEFVRWGEFQDHAGGTRVVLAGGGVLVADLIDISSERIVLESPVWGEIFLPLEIVRGVILANYADPLDRDRLESRVRSAAGSRDRLILKGGDEAEGLLVLPAPAAGPPLDNAERPIRRVGFTSRGGRAEVDLANVAAIIFNPALVAPVKPARPTAMIGLADGSWLMAERIELGSDIAGVTLAGIRSPRLTTDAETFRDEIVALAPNSPRVQFLSELAPSSYKHIPFLDLVRPYAFDSSLPGGRLRVRGAIYPHGIAMPGSSRLAFDVPPGWTRLAGQVAIDDTARGRGSAQFRVYLEAENGWRAAYDSGTVRGGEAPSPFSIELKGAKRIALIVGFADRGDVLDNAEWLEVRLEK